jgi:soluble lytic murein transglycosylase-like protein
MQAHCALMAALAGVALGCWLAAAERFQVPAALLRAIAHVESGDNASARNVNADGTIDRGLMQINSRWLPELRRFGIDESDLYVPCVSIHVGAWVLAQEIERYGYSWEAIGAYQSGPYDLRSKAKKLARYRVYANKVFAYWMKHQVFEDDGHADR